MRNIKSRNRIIFSALLKQIAVEKGSVKHMMVSRAVEMVLLLPPKIKRH